METLNCKLDDLSYCTVENLITEFYDMGYADSSSLPVELQDNTYGNFSISATKKFGEFTIKINKQTDGSLWLYVHPQKLKVKK